MATPRRPTSCIWEIGCHVPLTALGIEVCDQGPGIEPHELPHVTDRFFAGKKGKGTGLGLAIAEAGMSRIGGGLKFSPSHPSGQAVFLSVPCGTKPVL